jgi:chromosomal replication initiator protein
VAYLTTSDFMNEYVEYTPEQALDFIKKYTSIDVLLIDDINISPNGAAPTRQFYYIFNNLIRKKQIVICSDKQPDNMPDLEKDQSGFEMEAIVDIFLRPGSAHRHLQKDR